MIYAMPVGSWALNQHVGGGGLREPKDFDIWTNDPKFPATYDGLRVETFWHDGLVEFFENRPTDAVWPDIDELYTIKASHAAWALPNGSWDKHMFDLVKLKELGAQLQDDQFARLYKVWEQLHGKKIINLQQEKDEFFTDAVTRIYDHDSIHDSVAYDDEPMYVQTLKPGSTVDVDMKYIKSMPFEDQIKLFREEVYATALERWLIPNDYKFSPRRAYARALKKTITSLTKGWSSKFLVLNYDIMRDPDSDYLQRHLDKKHKLVPLEAK